MTQSAYRTSAISCSRAESKLSAQWWLARPQGSLETKDGEAVVVTSGTESRLQKTVRLLRTSAVDPVRVSRALPGEIWQRRANYQYLKVEVDKAWDEHLHTMLGAAWPCPHGQRLDEIMADISALLGARGLELGRHHTYGWYSDAESSLCRAVWCVALHIRPEVVIETGVAHAVSSRIVLEALRENDIGHLWSIDLLHPFNHRLHADTGVAVSDVCRPRWSYIEGSSRQRLPSLVAEVGHVGMFIHDSLHTARNTLFEMEQVASAMPVGAVMLVNDISFHDSFVTFAKRHPEYQTIICPLTETLGMFGIAVKSTSAEVVPAGP
jgi:hypothetical protein